MQSVITIFPLHRDIYNVVDAMMLASERCLCLGSEPKAGSALRAVENNVLALEENVAVDGETERGVCGLDTAEAS